MFDSVEPWEAVVSLTLVGAAIAVSLRYRLGVERSLALASARAGVQLLGVGFVLTFVLESNSLWWAWLWVGFMLGISGWTVQRRLSAIPRIWIAGTVAIGAATGVVLGVIFGLGILDLEPIPLVVIAGITIGNTMPATVQAVDQVRQRVQDRRGEIEGLLALGFDRGGATRFLVRDVARNVLIPQIERTKVVGLVALPGAMTGLLLAGADPVDAVLAQLVIMYLVLGSVATSVAVVTTSAARRALTPDLRVREGLDGAA
jgi:putative ABC transport system permease protein